MSAAGISDDDICAWHVETFAEVREAGSLSAIVLIHYRADGGELDLHTMTSKMRESQWNAETVGRMMASVAGRHARGLSGAQQFQLCALFGSEKKASKFLPFQRVGQLTGGGFPGGGLGSDGPTPAGITSVGMRWGELAIQGAQRKDELILNLFGNLLRELRDDRAQYAAEGRELFLALRSSMIDGMAAEHRQKLELVAAVRSARTWHEFTRMMPALVNGLTGTNVFPENTADATAFKALARHITPEMLQVMAGLAAKAGVEEQAAFASISSRFAKILEEDRLEAEKMRVANKQTLGIDGELDAMGEPVDPRTRLRAVLSGAASATPTVTAKQLIEGTAPVNGKANGATNGHAANEHTTPSGVAGSSSEANPGNDDDDALLGELLEAAGDNLPLLISTLAGSKPELAEKLKARAARTKGAST